MTLLTACSRTQQDWGLAQKADTAQAYKVFVARHPDSELAAVARQRIAQLTEEAEWEQAAGANTAAAYQDYLAKYPNGSWSQDARIRMESRSLAAAPAAGTGPTGASAAADPTASASPQSGSGDATADSTAAPPAPASRTAAAAAAVRADTAPASAGHSAVQLGAFSSVGNAHTAWRQLAAKFQPQLRGLVPRVVPVMLSGRRLYRLEAGVASQAAAHRLCRQLQQHSQGCLPVS